MNRKSRQRAAISRVLRGTSSHPSAKWIYEQVKREVPNIGMATVYRNLRLKREAGEISEIHTLNQATRFDHRIDNHYHFTCDRCGLIMDLDEPVDAGIEKRIAERTGLKVTWHRLELGGLCLDCQKRATAGEQRPLH